MYLLMTNFPKLLNKFSIKVIKDSDYELIDLMIVIGGDGSILSFCRKYGSLGIPLLGINLGRLGFLADIPPDNISHALLRVVGGNYKTEERAFLEASK